MKDYKTISKFLSLVLRHQPEKIDLELDINGWANVSDLLEKLPFNISFDVLKDIVVTNDKQRFSFNQDNSLIRANQGHSLQGVDLKLDSITPPKILYHGTVDKFILSIKEEGLNKKSRQHVHLSADITTASNVGSRRGRPIILGIEALKMHQKGIEFYKSKNGVWLTDKVPSEYIIFNLKL